MMMMSSVVTFLAYLTNDSTSPLLYQDFPPDELLFDGRGGGGGRGMNDSFSSHHHQDTSHMSSSCSVRRGGRRGGDNVMMMPNGGGGGAGGVSSSSLDASSMEPAAGAALSINEDMQLLRDCLFLFQVRHISRIPVWSCLPIWIHMCNSPCTIPTYLHHQGINGQYVRYEPSTGTHIIDPQVCMYT